MFAYITTFFNLFKNIKIIIAIIGIVGLSLFYFITQYHIKNLNTQIMQLNVQVVEQKQQIQNLHDDIELNKKMLDDYNQRISDIDKMAEDAIKKLSKMNLAKNAKSDPKKTTAQYNNVLQEQLNQIANSTK